MMKRRVWRRAILALFWASLCSVVAGCAPRVLKLYIGDLDPSQVAIVSAGSEYGLLEPITQGGSVYEEPASNFDMRGQIIFVDSIPSLRSDEFRFVPGTYEIRVEYPASSCHLTLTVQAGRRYYLNSGLDPALGKVAFITDSKGSIVSVGQVERD